GAEIRREQFDQRAQLRAAANVTEHNAPTPRVSVSHIERRQTEQFLRGGLGTVDVADVVEANLVPAIGRDEAGVVEDVGAAFPQPPLPGGQVKPTMASRNSPSAPASPTAGPRRTDSP